MKLKSTWRQKTLEQLENEIWPPLASGDYSSYLIQTCSALRSKPLQNFTTEDLRIMIGQEVGLYFLMPLAIEKLATDLFANGDMYPGDLLKNTLEIDVNFWNNNKAYWQQLHDLIKDRRPEIAQHGFDSTRFESCKHNR